MTLVEPRTLLAAARTPPARFDVLLPQAHAHRPEIVEQLRLIDAADRTASARGYSLLPDVNAEAAYLRTDGQVFAPKNSAYVGVKAEWSIWEWGASNHLRRAALADAAAARRDLEATERQIESDLAISLAQGDAARGAVDAAEKAIASAEEAFRVTQAQVKAGAATTTDLLAGGVGADPGAPQPDARAVRAGAGARRREARVRRVANAAPVCDAGASERTTSTGAASYHRRAGRRKGDRARWAARSPAPKRRTPPRPVRGRTCRRRSRAGGPARPPRWSSRGSSPPR